MGGMRPVIGVSCYGERARWGAWDVDAVLLHRAYVEALESSGAAVVLIPPMHDESSIDAVLEKLDGLVLAGGADLEPASYGAEAHETTDAPRLDRDATERLLYHGARELGLPVLGVCRGMQVMAVASGGALIQDLPSAGYGTAHREAPGTFTEHGATFAPNSLAARIHGGTELVVNSSHHQAVADPGTLRITGHAADGTVEVLEDQDAAFVIGVQWHPEMSDDHRLFAALAAAARRSAHVGS
jgi:putative glutamine amidotransferase